MKKSRFLFACGTALILLITSCGSSTKSPGEGETNIPSIALKLKLTSQATAKTSLVAPTKANVGQAAATELTSLKYYITSITICESMTTTGSGYNNPTGCLELYEGNKSDSRYTYQLGEDYARFGDVARQAGDDGFIDLMSDTSRATLNTSKTLTTSDARSYNYGYINWYLPIKVTAQVNMGSGVIYRTADGTTTTPSSGSAPTTTASSDFSQVATAQEAVIVHANGGSWFRFQNPFVISDSDITNNTQFSLDLTFNPEGLLKGYVAGLGGCGTCVLKDSVGHQLLVPMLDLTPVPHKSTDAVVKETYISTVKSGADNFDIQIELYYVDGDASKTIYGVDTATLVNSNTTTAVSPFSKVSFIKTESDGTLTFQDYNGDSGPLITGFQRQTTVGDTFTATLHCGDQSTGGFNADGCKGGATKDITFTLQSIATLQ